MSFLIPLGRFFLLFCLCYLGWGGLHAESSDRVGEEMGATALSARIFAFPKTPTHGERPCLFCNEKGMTQSEIDPSIAHKKRRAKHKQIHDPKALMVKCKICKGTKKVYRKLYLDERVELYLKQRAEFDKCHQTAYRKRVGSAYADAEVVDALMPEEFAKLAARYPAVCKKCYGFAMTLCSTCDGVGRVRQKEEDAAGETIYKMVICSTCDGDGGKPCKVCDASGLLRQCKRCNGLGVVEQRARRDTPAFLERCKSCLGMGRR